MILKANKLIKFIFSVTVIIFFCAYFIERTGYYEYKLQNRKVLTEQEMTNFENDIKEGKDVDIRDYLSNTNVDYSTNLTKTTSNISIKLNKYLKNFLVNGFDVFDALFK